MLSTLRCSAFPQPISAKVSQSLSQSDGAHAADTDHGSAARLKQRTEPPGASGQLWPLEPGGKGAAASGLESGRPKPWALEQVAAAVVVAAAAAAAAAAASNAHAPTTRLARRNTRPSSAQLSSARLGSARQTKQSLRVESHLCARSTPRCSPVLALAVALAAALTAAVAGAAVAVAATTAAAAAAAAARNAERTERERVRPATEPGGSSPLQAGRPSGSLRTELIWRNLRPIDALEGQTKDELFARR